MLLCCGARLHARPLTPQVMFWDVRLDKLLKNGNKRVDEADIVWKPMHVVHLLSLAGERGGHLLLSAVLSALLLVVLLARPRTRSESSRRCRPWHSIGCCSDWVITGTILTAAQCASVCVPLLLV